jgi:hypothetical protein
MYHQTIGAIHSIAAQTGFQWQVCWPGNAKKQNASRRLDAAGLKAGFSRVLAFRAHQRVSHVI